ncbi:hypothetical protein [Pseudomonas knackmussii]|uniref:hypothetical protein n=1 Tax=Pseudomonas knackmussii TaxID=65741 RepID=UPI003F4A103F
MDVLAILQQSIDATVKLRDLSKKIENAEFKGLLADLSMSLADAKLEIVGLKQQLAEALTLNAQLAEQLAQRAQDAPVLRDSCYSFEGQEGLFCTACWDTHQRKIRVKAVSSTFHFAGKWSCPSCKAYYGAA